MKTVKCKNCGASFDETLEKCPYCGTMNRKGAYRSFRSKIASMIDAVLGLKDDIHRSVSRIIWMSLIRSVIIIALIAGLAFICSRFANVNFYNDKEYDQKAFEEISWMDEHLDQLNAAYESGDYKTIDKLYVENAQGVQHWPLYPSFCLKKAYEDILDEEGMNVYLLRDILYFCYNPEYYSGYNTINKLDAELYEGMKSEILHKAEEAGYSEAELEEIFTKLSDTYKYLNFEELKKYVKEAGNA